MSLMFVTRGEVESMRPRNGGEPCMHNLRAGVYPIWSIVSVVRAMSDLHRIKTVEFPQ